MKLQLPITGQVIRGQGSSLFSAKQKTFIAACREYSINKNSEMESRNKSTLVKFYNTKMQEKGLPDEKGNETDLERNSSADTIENSMNTTATSDTSKIENDHKTDSNTSLLNEKEKERLKYDGLSRFQVKNYF